MHGQVSLNDSMSIEESHRLIDEAIAQHQVAISRLKSQKNGLAPISRLHPELLCLIFSLLKTKASFRYKDTSHLDWIIVTHVSSHWRHVALDSPTLWVDLPLKNPRWVQEMLQRSRNAGLVIDAHLRLTPALPVAPGLELALQHSWRIKHLSIQGFDGSTWNDLQKAMPRSAPQLEYLCLTGDGNLFDTRSAFAFSEEVFCDTGHLRHFKLSRCSLDWTSHPSLLRNLTHLTLLYLTPGAKPTGNQFINALTRMPDLQSLCMVHGLPIEQTWSFERIHLASLRNLSIESTHPELDTFFRCITFPPTAMVHVNCFVEDTFTSEVDILSGLFRSYSTPFRNLVVLQPQRLNGVFLKLFANDRENLDDPMHCYSSVANLEITFAWMAKSQSREQYIDIAKFMTDIFDSRVLLQSVCMDIDLTGIGDELSVETIANTFGILPRVRSIRAGRKTSRLFLEALWLGLCTEEWKPTNASEKLYFPNLSSIYFAETVFWNLEFFGSTRDQWSTTVESLKDCLIRRSEIGAKVKTLTLSRCYCLRKSDVDTLSIIGVEIHYDKCDILDDSEEEYSEEERRNDNDVEDEYEGRLPMDI